MPYIGKIGRLPKHLRHQLGHRLENNHPGSEIVQWLNNQKETQDILDRYFQGRLITEQNLSEWRQSGHQDWLRRQEAQAAVRNLLEHSEDLEALTDGQNLSDCFAAILAAEMTRLAAALLEPETDPEKKWERLCQIHRELSRLRRDDDRATRTAISKERAEREAERAIEEREERRKESRKQELSQASFHRMLGLLNDRVPPSTTQSTPPHASHASPPSHSASRAHSNPPVISRESKQIQPNPTKNNKSATPLQNTPSGMLLEQQPSASETRSHP